MVPRVAVYPTVELTRGAAFFDTITVTDPDTGAAVDLTGLTIKWQFRAGRTSSGTLLADLGITASTLLTVTAATGLIEPFVAGSLTTAWPVSVWHDARVIDAGQGNRVLYWWRGEVVPVDGVTPPP